MRIYVIYDNLYMGYMICDIFKYFVCKGLINTPQFEMWISNQLLTMAHTAHIAIPQMDGV